MKAKLYSLSLSHPSHAARLMLELKRIEHEVIDLVPGMHPIQLRLAGFRHGTVPAVAIAGRRVQGSLAISRALDEIEPRPPLFAEQPERRRAIEEAEAWGESVLQPVPRRIFRWVASHSGALRRWMASAVGMPAPGLMAALNRPVAGYFAWKISANDERVRADIAELPALLNHVDALIARGVMGGRQLNAADFQIGTTTRVLRAFEDLAPLVDGRPAGELANRVLPNYPGRIPLALPNDWLASAGLGRARAAA